MGKVRVMSDALASQVAAGEVVERPASVVKELLENSLDAGARRVEVLVERGGASLIRVVDDGAGMSREDALLSVERHATSKLRSKDDLERVTTYGFRGEALPSIASVSRFRMATREHGALAGTEVLIDGGKLKEVRDCGEAPGTQIEVRSLFFNVPARRKFLRAEATEYGHIESAVRVAAIAQPAVAFSLRHGTRQVFQIGAASGRLERIADLAGQQLAEGLLEVAGEGGVGGIGVTGWVGPPGSARPNRALQYVFLNGRPIDSPAVGFALREAYAGLLERGRHPPVFLFIEADPATVDVNVHPAKREVRFHDGRGLQRAVASAVQGALARKLTPARGAAPAPPVSGGAIDVAPVRELPPGRDLVVQAAEVSVQPSLPVKVPGGGLGEAQIGSITAGGPTPTGNHRDPSEPPGVEGATTEFRLLGTLDDRYLVLEGDEGLVLLHRKAAHERVLYEEALAALEGAGTPSQALLTPVTLQLVPEDYQVAIDHSEPLARLGVGVEAFGANTVKIDRLPASCGDRDPATFVSALVAEIRERGAAVGKRIGERDLAASISRRAARDGESGHREEHEGLLRRLMRCDMPYCDPKGRPTLIQFSHQELARKFART